jgi:acyl-CoA synthetase (NDP forming)
VVLKVGRSDAGRRAALAHTGSLVGSDAVADALLRQHGLIRVSSLDQMTETLALFHSRRLPRGNGVAIGVVSGGAAGLLADLSTELGVECPPLAPATAARIEKVIPPFGSVGNPLDYTGQAAQQPEILEGCFSALAEDPNLHVIVYGQAYPALIDLAQPAGAVLRTLPERYPDKVFVVASLVGGELKGRNLDFPEAEPIGTLDGIPFLQGAENSLRAIASLTQYAAFLRARATAPPIEPTPPSVVARARDLVRAAGGRPLGEREAKAVLVLYGIPITREHLATAPEAAVAAAHQLGYPVALKIESPDLLHKTEAGGVLLNLADDDEVRLGYAQVVAAAARHRPNATVRGVLVQEMLGGDWHEVILGMTRDPAFGPAVAVGLGGIFVETLKDVALGLPPLRPDDARAMLARLRGWPILTGAGGRGRAPADLHALVATLVRFAQLCDDLGDLVTEIDVNPLAVFAPGEGVRVVDCLIVPRSSSGT